MQALSPTSTKAPPCHRDTRHLEAFVDLGLKSLISHSSWYKSQALLKILPQLILARETKALKLLESIKAEFKMVLSYLLPNVWFVSCTLEIKTCNCIWKHLKLQVILKFQAPRGSDGVRVCWLSTEQEGTQPQVALRICQSDLKQASKVEENSYFCKKTKQCSILIQSIFEKKKKKK